MSREIIIFPFADYDHMVKYLLLPECVFRKRIIWSQGYTIESRERAEPLPKENPPGPAFLDFQIKFVYAEMLYVVLRLCLIQPPPSSPEIENSSTHH